MKLFLFYFLLAFCFIPADIYAQVGINTENPDPTSILDVKADNKGILIPNLTEEQRNNISPPANGLLIFNTDEGCFNYYNAQTSSWLSLCGSAPPAIAEISPLQCSSIKAEGNYKEGVSLTQDNFLSIPVTVIKAGSYDFIASTSNGYYFSVSGTFPDVGNYTLLLNGTGKPKEGYILPDPGDVVSIQINGKTSDCNPTIFVEKAEVNYSINCANITQQGNYYINTPLNNTNKLSVEVNVTNIGYWNITSNSVNGYSFSGSGEFTTTGVQTIELQGTGTPDNSGINLFNLSSNSNTPSSCSSVPVTVETVSYSMDCSTATVNGYYQQDVDLTEENTITLPVNVLATGQTTITTNTIDGVYFTSGTINLNTLGVQYITLTGTGKPTTSGIKTFTLTGTPGATATCQIPVTINAQPVSYNLDCSAITLSGNYLANAVMTSSNTLTVYATVQYTGNYSLTTNTVNGVTFSANGTFSTTGYQPIVLTASGTATTGGTFTYTFGNGAATCTKDVTFTYRPMKILGLGGGIYQPGTAGAAESARSILLSSQNFGPSGTFPVNGNLSVINGGTAQGAALSNAINTNNIDIIIIGYNYNPDASSITVLNDFVKNKKGVVLHSQETGNTSAQNLVNTIFETTGTTINGTGTTYANPILSINDPIINGPFGDLRGKYAGNDVNNSYYIQSAVPANGISLIHQNNNPSRIWLLKHNSLGFVYIGDSGWMAGNTTSTNLDIYPNATSTGGIPRSKTYYSSGTPSQVSVYNSALYANLVAWAIEYAQENTVTTYTVPNP